MEFFGDDIEDDDDELSEELSNDEKREAATEHLSQNQQAKVQHKTTVNRVEQEKQPEEKKGIGSRAKSNRFCKWSGLCNECTSFKSYR